MTELDQLLSFPSLSWVKYAPWEQEGYCDEQGRCWFQQYGKWILAHPGSVVNSVSCLPANINPTDKSLSLPLNQKKLILQRLTEVAAEQELTLLYAVESGSRAWGFESPDSDWDVRFFYLRSHDYYLWNLDPKKRDSIDAVEYPVQPDQIDIAGWDLLKTCKLLLASNPAALEWLDSPICYYNRQDILSDLKALVPLVYNRRSAMYHYQHMAQTNWRK